MGFWLISGLIAVVAVAIMLAALLRQKAETADAAATFDMQVYRDQLKELDRDLARGTVTAGEVERTRTEISRRLLEADRKAQKGTQTGQAPTGLTYGAAVIAVLIVAGGGFFLYDRLGAAGYPDLGLKVRMAAAKEARETRPSQAEAEAELPAWAGPPLEAPDDYVALVDRLRTAVADRPNDIEGQMLMSDHEAALGNYVAAHTAAARIIDLKGDGATAGDYAKLADLMILATDGYVSPEAETALAGGLNIDPNNHVSLYYTGLMYAQTGRPDIAFRLWRGLLEDGPQDGPWLVPIRAQIEGLGAMAGVDYTAPAAPAPMAPMVPGMPGPTAEDVEAAGDMTAEEQQDMVQGMVSNLMERLATEGGPAADWARLINALGVMGNAERAQAIYEEAKGRFEGRDEDLATLHAAAVAAGISE